MSNLYRSALQARISKLPQLPSDASEEEDVDEEDEAKSSIGALPGRMGPPAACASTAKAKSPNPAFAPISASSYFASANQVAVPSRQLDFRVYYTPPASKSSKSATEDEHGESGTVLVCHHGAGFSGLSFACFAKEVQSLSRGALGVLALDARRHGKTVPIDNASDEDLSVGVLAVDLVSLLQTVFPDSKKAPAVLLVGHSMGGSVVVQACPEIMAAGYSVLGVAVLDVVEGTALEALPFMNSILNARPDGFDSVEEAIEWHVKSHSIRNPTSARVSVPSIIVPSSEETGKKYVWRTPLRSTGAYWENWFTGLSSRFLATRTARLLILAGTDRLDKELMIGQMQGKFQLEVVGGGVGHVVHEDDPMRIAEIIVEFWRRNERVVLPGVKGKVIKRVGEV
ncbi:protein phosphatase methylesterase [Gloeophyllum trabeum ATCC 11539]|uniref:Protein phosphatase methylesterase 1 n=1 Tax=Gloeophyllum trabeum (strain ATCC 11539 / FP-39264 / Madison 617) TaxID=670483 RepID=S7Q1Z2_GLOTA|nr:protein phosphatase methylesterase [Gloeophyllum trabeum ATCC 11539]EPQ54031.1 protein phosphatase methylesterase [Gloeophyllum trabeum ATCC 11539]